MIVQVKGRGVIACDTVGGLDAVAATGTLVRRRKTAQPAASIIPPISLVDHRIVRAKSGAPPGRGP